MSVRFICSLRSVSRLPVSSHSVNALPTILVSGESLITAMPSTADPRTPPSTVTTSLDADTFDSEARVQFARYHQLVIANVYFPNGNGKQRDNSRVPYKLAFYQALRDRLDTERKAGHRVIVMGDFNTAPHDIDLARPRQNVKTSGCLPEERAELGDGLGAGWVETCRTCNPQAGNNTWGGQRKGVRERNIGWRIDLVLACPEAMRYISRGFIWPQVRGSDHCPIGVSLDARELLS